MDWSHRIVTRTTGMTRAARFADAVAARHAGDPGAWLRCSTRPGGVARVLLRRRRVVAAPATFNVTPRLELRLATRARASDATRQEQRSTMLIARELPRTVSAPSAAPILQRANTRGVRDDGRAPGPSASVRREAPTKPVAHVDAARAGAEPVTPARVLRRRAPAVTPSPAPVGAAPSVRATIQPARPVQLSPVEINRLTDHIVQTIDRRIVAFRERQGRV